MWDALPAAYRAGATVLTDVLASYRVVVPAARHRAVGLRNETKFPNTSSFIYDEGGKRGRMCQVGERAVWTADGKKEVKETFVA